MQRQWPPLLLRKLVVRMWRTSFLFSWLLSAGADGTYSQARTRGNARRRVLRRGAPGCSSALTWRLRARPLPGFGDHVLLSPGPGMWETACGVVGPVGRGERG